MWGNNFYCRMPALMGLVILLSTARAVAATNSPATAFPSAGSSMTLAGGDWRVQNAALVKATPENIVGLGFDDDAWLPAIVPGTVLGSYVSAGAAPNPWFGDQANQIPDDLFSQNDFWYRDTFRLPAEDAGQRLWLIFDGINWKVDIFLNGHAVGHIAGAFIRGRFDVTAFARPGDSNCLAVLIHHATHAMPGKGKVLYKKLGSPTTNGGSLGADSPSFLASIGWNWLPIVPGRDIGIWNNVRLETSGDVSIVDP